MELSKKKKSVDDAYDKQPYLDSDSEIEKDDSDNDNIKPCKICKTVLPIDEVGTTYFHMLIQYWLLHINIDQNFNIYIDKYNTF